jgi:hypothetical protein
LYRNKKIEVQVRKNIKLVNPADYWLYHPMRREYKGVGFFPDGAPDGYYNFWRGFAFEPKKGSGHRPYLSHVRENICRGNGELYAWVKAWLADAVQNPAKRPGTALVLLGGQGVGKGQFVKHLGKLLGPHYTYVTGQHRITGNFNSHLKMTLLVFVDEGFWAGDKKAAGTLKGLITEDTLLIEEKFVNPVLLKNNIRVIMASNSDWVVPAGLDERRFCVLDVGDRHQKDYPFFKTINDEMKNGGYENLLYELLNWDTTSQNLHKIPRTQALFDQIVASMDSFEKWWLFCLQTGKIDQINDVDWPRYLLPQDVYQAYKDHANSNRERYLVGYHPFFRKLNKICPGYRLKKKDRGSGWLNYSRFPYLDECRQNFEQKVQISIPWDNDDVPF